jgi:hypothetical protein
MPLHGNFVTGMTQKKSPEHRNGPAGEIELVLCGRIPAALSRHHGLDRPRLGVNLQELNDDDQKCDQRRHSRHFTRRRFDSRHRCGVGATEAGTSGDG